MSALIDCALVFGIGLILGWGLFGLLWDITLWLIRSLPQE